MKHKLFVFLVLGMALLLSCCDAAPEIPQTEIPPEITYISADVTYSEPAEQYAFRLNMDFTETTYAKFYFEPEIDPKERDACIEVTQNVPSSTTSWQKSLRENPEANDCSMTFKEMAADIFLASIVK